MRTLSFREGRLQPIVRLKFEAGIDGQSGRLDALDFGFIPCAPIVEALRQGDGPWVDGWRGAKPRPAYALACTPLSSIVSLTWLIPLCTRKTPSRS